MKHLGGIHFFRIKFNVPYHSFDNLDFARLQPNFPEEKYQISELLEYAKCLVDSNAIYVGDKGGGG